jgi:hypothetical protein
MAQAKGSSGILSLQYEEAYNADPAVPDTTKIYFETEGFKGSRNLVASAVLTGSRQPSAPIQGNIDAVGPVATELGAYPAMLFYGAAGSIKTEANGGAGEVVGAALAAATGVIDSYNQEITFTIAAHGLLAGDTVQVLAITAPVALNGTYLRVKRVPTVGTFVCRLPLGVTGVFTAGAGTLKKVTTPATTYKHTLKFGGVLPSFIADKGFPDIGQYFKYNGAKIGKYSLGAVPEGFQKVSFDFTASKETTGTTPFDSTATDLTKASFSGFMLGTIEEGGAAIANVTKVDISVENNLDTGVYVIGGAGTRGSLPEGTCKVSGTLEALFSGLELYNKAKASTESSLKLIYQSGTGAGTSGNESLEIFLPELIFQQEAPAISGDKGVMISVPFQAFYTNSAEATVAQIILKNTQLAV